MSKNMHQQISLRLKMIYNLIPQCNKIGDVGTDHGFLPIYAIENGKCKLALASDLREGPINVAQKNIKESSLENKIETFLTAGMDGYNSKECDVVVIAGMGGITICKILEDWLLECKRTKYFPGNITFVLQPNTHEHLVREFLWNNGFNIEEEDSVKDGNHVYLGIKGNFENNINQSFSETECYLGKIITKRLSDNDIIYLYYLKNKHRNILSGLNKKIDIDENIALRKELSLNILFEIDKLLKGDIKNGMLKS